MRKIYIVSLLLVFVLVIGGCSSDSWLILDEPGIDSDIYYENLLSNITSNTII